MESSTRLESTEVDVPSTLAAQLAVSCATAPAAIAEAMRTSSETLGRFLQRNAMTPAGPRRAIYTTWSGSTTSFTLAFPVASAPAIVVPVHDCAVGRLSGGRAFRFVHRGSHLSLPHTYARIDAWLHETGAIRSRADWDRFSGMWEEFVTEPGSVPDAELLVHIHLPIPTA